MTNISFLAIHRSDSVSSNSKRKISSISASETSDHDISEDVSVVQGNVFYYTLHVEKDRMKLTGNPVASLEIPEASESPCQPEETVEDDPALEVQIAPFHLTHKASLKPSQVEWHNLNDDDMKSVLFYF